MGKVPASSPPKQPVLERVRSSGVRVRFTGPTVGLTRMILGAVLGILALAPEPLSVRAVAVAIALFLIYLAGMADGRRDALLDLYRRDPGPARRPAQRGTGDEEPLAGSS